MVLQSVVFTLDIWWFTLGLNPTPKHNGEEEEEETNCPYGYENCDEDDFESMCDGCKEDRGQAHEDARMDTYD